MKLLKVLLHQKNRHIVLEFVLQTAKQFHDHPEKRTPIAMEILSSEVEYNRILQAVKDVYVKPLRAALNSNRYVLKLHYH